MVFRLLSNASLPLMACTLMIAFTLSTPLIAQSTFGSIVGTVKDSAGALVPGATVSLSNAGTSAVRTITTNQAGEYSFLNLNAAKYQITIVAPGFEKIEFADLDLQAREIKRVDADLKLGAASETITVEGASAGTITTEVSNLSETKTGRELTELPVAVYSRSTGSTSAILTLSTEPGVQVDDNSNMVVDGTTPALMSYTIDGISSVSVENSGPINELFPSFNSISEIRISGSNNNAEFSGVADVTTTSKSGTNQLHGGAFENLENTVLTAGDPFTQSRPKIIMNDFGGFIGGPITIPHLYSGKDRLFFFASYEGLRLPRTVPFIASVPSLDMRAGNLTNYLAGTPIYNYDGTQLDPSNVPVNPVSANILKYFMPLPNTGGVDSYQKNYRVNEPAPITSDQADLRLDYALTSKQSFFVRGTYKNRQVTAAPDPNCGLYCATVGSPLTGEFNQPQSVQGVTFSYNYAISASVMNELRAGFNGIHNSNVMSQGTSAGYLNQSGIQGITEPDPVTEVPNAVITGFMQTGGASPSIQHSNIVQILDNFTWTKGTHTFKFGGDARRMTDHDDNVFGSYQSGQYVFNNSTAFTAADGSSVSIGDPYTGFLLGLPDYTLVAEQVDHPAMNGQGYGYGFFAQDDWKITHNLTLNLGMRYELHPPLKDINYNTADFLPSYNQNGVAGAVVVPNAQAEGYNSADFVTSIAPSPVITAAQAGIPETLRYTYKKDFGPRIGLAWRPYGNDKMVIRGGWGRFIEQPLGFSLVSGWAVNSCFVNYSAQSQDVNGNPTISFPTPFSSTVVPGGASFEYAFPVHYIDPSVQQWNVTVEQDLGHDIGLRFSYIGSHGSNLETFVDLNQVPANTVGWNTAFAQSAPFQSWDYIQSIVNGAQSNYDSMSVAFTRRFSHGLQFQSSYLWTRDLSDGQGYSPSSLTTEGGSISSDRFNLGRDYGNVSFDRRHRFLTTYLYELPFGTGKAWLTHGGAVNTLAGGWQIGGVLVLQSGAFLTPYQTTTDPAGTNLLSNAGSTRADRVTGVNPYVHNTSTSTGDPVYFNSNAFVDPPNNSGGFGNAGVGNIVGPGTEALSLSLVKTTKLWEGVNFQFGAEASNLLNHRNYETPDMNVDDGPGGFGVITALQTAEGAGPRNIEITGRISF